MDKLEQFFQSNKKHFNYINTDESNWEQLNTALYGETDDSGPIPIHKKAKRYIWIWATAAAILLFLLVFKNQKETQTAQDYSDLVTLIGLEEEQYFPDLALQNPDGKMIPLSSLNAQVVLVDFWASSCMVCNEENCYYFKPLYNEFRNKGFEIYSVSVDSSAINWKNAIQRDGLDWVQVSDLKGFESNVIDDYQVEALPTNYLLDQNGKIIAKNINVEDLANQLHELLAFH